MSRSFSSDLEKRTELRLLELFPRRVTLGLLYKSSHHGHSLSTLFSLCRNQGSFVLLVFLQGGLVRGGFLSKSIASYNGKYGVHDQDIEDQDAFVFSVDEEKATRFRVVDHRRAFSCSWSWVHFGDSLKLSIIYKKKNVFGSEFQFDYIYEHTGWTGTHECEVELHRVEAGDVLYRPWRDVQWTELERESLRNDLVSYEPSNEELTQVRVLLLGPAGAGKSSIINSIRSVLYRRVVNLPIIGAESHGFTKKLKSYPIRAEKGGATTALTLCDAMALGNHKGRGMTLHDALAVIEGHAPEGHEFQPEAPIQPSTAGYRLDPSLKDKIHCVVFTLDACELTYYSNGLKETLRKLHSEISDLEIPQLVFLTHVDEVCHAVHKDVRYVYSSCIVQEKMKKAAELVDMPVSFVLPIKNYCSEVAVDRDIDILLLSAVGQVLNAVEDTFEN